MAWFLAPTLVTLRSEINKRWPIRDKTSDGSLGNTSHAAGTSDHNPDSRGCVCAIDVDEDVNRRATEYPSFHAGQPLNELLGELLKLAKAGKLPQLRYIIYEGYIYSSTYGFKKQEYHGSNPHDHHMHISCSHTPSLADSTRTWYVYPEEDDMALSADDKTWIRNTIKAELAKIWDADTVPYTDPADPANTNAQVDNVLAALLRDVRELLKRTS